jgi:hypothetical protein
MFFRNYIPKLSETEHMQALESSNLQGFTKGGAQELKVEKRLGELGSSAPHEKSAVPVPQEKGAVPVAPWDEKASLDNREKDDGTALMVLERSLDSEYAEKPNGVATKASSNV